MPEWDDTSCILCSCIYPFLLFFLNSTLNNKRPFIWDESKKERKCLKVSLAMRLVSIFTLSLAQAVGHSRALSWQTSQELLILQLTSTWNMKACPDTPSPHTSHNDLCPCCLDTIPGLTRKCPWRWWKWSFKWKDSLINHFIERQKFQNFQGRIVRDILT